MHKNGIICLFFRETRNHWSQSWIDYNLHVAQKCRIFIMTWELVTLAVAKLEHVPTDGYNVILKNWKGKPWAKGRKTVREFLHMYVFHIQLLFPTKNCTHSSPIPISKSRTYFPFFFLRSWTRTFRDFISLSDDSDHFDKIGYSSCSRHLHTCLKGMTTW